MNLFILSLNPTECASQMMDKHVIKIILEAVQMLCTAKRVLDPEDPICDSLYKMAHKNHPVTIWVRSSIENYMWTLDLVDAMHSEWQYRYEHCKQHKSLSIAMMLRENPPKQFPETGLTPFAKAMPEEYKRIEDPIEAYKAYYCSEEKRRIATWKKREKPHWFTQGDISIFQVKDGKIQQIIGHQEHQKPKKERTEKPKKERTEKPKKERTEKPKKERTEKPKKERTEKPKKERTEKQKQATEKMLKALRTLREERAKRKKEQEEIREPVVH
jgi:hypothetical protein